MPLKYALKNGELQLTTLGHCLPWFCGGWSTLTTQGFQSRGSVGGEGQK